MFGQLGMTEILLILVVVLLLFGAKRIPEVAASMGKGIREFKRNLSDVNRSIQEEINAPQDRVGAPRQPDALKPAAPADQAATEQQHPEPKRLLS